MEHWWDRYPNELANEYSALSEGGFKWSKDEAAFSRGRLILHIKIEHKNESFNVKAEYPDTYPYFPPTVTSNEKTLSRHQHPIGNDLCLLARDGEDWEPGTDTLAKLLTEQLPKILSVNNTDLSSDYVSENEDHVGEPISSFLNYLQNSAIMVPDDTPTSTAKTGLLKLKLSSNLASYRGVLESIADINGNTLVDNSIRLPDFTIDSLGYWIRLDEKPDIDKLRELPQTLHNIFKERLPNTARQINNKKCGHQLIIGFIWQDEKSWRSNSDDWVFLHIEVTQQQKRSRPASLNLNFVRADWGGQNAWMQRAPYLLPIRKKRALLIGLGAIGSPVAIQLAKAGIGSLDLVDCDYLQVGNTIRWALGWNMFGLSKVGAIAAYITAAYPNTKIYGHDIRIGFPTPLQTIEDTSTDYEIIKSKIEAADIVIDASANHRLSHLLSDFSKELSKPYIWLTSTHGAEGGVVGRIRPTNSEGCWHCFQHSLTDTSIRLPADSGDAAIQPAGCSQATFIGASLDSDEITLLASRLTIATLCSEETDGYTDFDWDVAVVDLKRHGISIAPEWTTYPLKKNPKCQICNPTTQ